MSLSQSPPSSAKPGNDSRMQWEAVQKQDDWTSIGLHQYLDVDSRPAMVVDLMRSPESDRLLYTNAVFRSTFQDNDSSLENGVQHAFYQWASSPLLDSKRHMYRGMSWSASTIKERWRVISGTEVSSLRTVQGRDWQGDSVHSTSAGKSLSIESSIPRNEGDEEKPPARKRKHSHRSSGMPFQTPPGHDITHELPPNCPSAHITMLREHDWSLTALGPMQNWSSRLRTAVNLLISDPHPAVLFWGPQLAGIYNEAYLPLVAGKHPKSLGQPFRETWKELYDQPDVGRLVDSLWETGYETGKGIRQDHQMYHLLLNGRFEEKYFTLGMLPILEDDGTVEGFYEPLTDVTKDYVNSRRQMSIMKVAEDTAGVQNINDFFSRMIDALHDNLYDIPYAIVYSVDSDRQHEEDTEHPPQVDKTDFRFAKLEGTVGINLSDDGKPVAELLQDEHFRAAFRKACRLGEFVTFEINPHLRHDIINEASRRGFGDPPDKVVLCPIEPTTQKTTAALLVLGVNTRAPLNSEYMTFVRSLSRSISSSLASVMLLNMASRRTLEAAHGEQVAKGMLNVAPVGAYLITLEGEILYANPTWYDLTEYNKYQNDQTPMSWMQVLVDEHQGLMTREWEMLIKERRPRRFELRLRKVWKGSDPVTGELIHGPSYVLADATIQTIDGADYVIGCMTDISRQKWNEEQERQRREEAVELKRQQENFIDMTSHEMRNPLSAIFQSADGIISVLTSYQQHDNSLSSRKSSITSLAGTSSPGPNFDRAEGKIAFAIDAAATIALCAQHQKRIVDDVLILSKMDANRLEISPVEVQVQTLIEQSLKMFAAELASNEIKMRIITDESFHALRVDWVKMDPSRLLQILINLCTNAIKFTATGETRNIEVVLGASSTAPIGDKYGVQWLPREAKEQDPTLREDWGLGEQIYLTFVVEDTGRGMSEQEMSSLFQRFSQASPRTHTQYGGSGLGLFIAKLLTQLQGGEIGVASVPGKGSTFAFCIKARRVDPPSESVKTTGTPQRVGTPSGMAIPIHPAPRQVATSLERISVQVLVVEDNLVNQKVLRQQLKNLNWTVYLANNGQEAVEFVKTTTFWKGNEASGIPLTLILMDVEMPIMNGTAATREIRRFESEGQISSHVPIIAITANARMEQVAVARESGMDDVVAKPFRIPELVAKVEALLDDSA